MELIYRYMDSASCLVGSSAEYCFTCMQGIPAPGYAVQKMEIQRVVLSYFVFLMKLYMMPHTYNFSTGEVEAVWKFQVSMGYIERPCLKQKLKHPRMKLPWIFRMVYPVNGYLFCQHGLLQNTVVLFISDSSRDVKGN